MQNQSAPFALTTRRLRQLVATMQITGASQQIRTDLLQVGYLGKVWVRVFGTITVGASPAGNLSNYFPGNIISKISVRSNEGLELYSSDGYTNINIVQPVYEMGYNPGQQINPISNNTANTTSGGMRTGISTGPLPGAVITTGTYNINMWFLLPMAVDDRLSAGVFLMQNSSTRVSVEISSNNLNGNGGMSGMLNAAGTLGTGGSMSLNVQVFQEAFSAPADPGSQPDTSYIHRWITDTAPWTTSGEQVYKLPVNGIVSRIIADFENNGAQQPWFSTPGNPNTSLVGNQTVQYAASQSPEIYDQVLNMLFMRRDYCQDLPDGCNVIEMSNGGGNVSMGWSGRDVYDTSTLTEFAIKHNINVVPTSGKIRYTRQELQRRGS